MSARAWGTHSSRHNAIVNFLNNRVILVLLGLYKWKMRPKIRIFSYLTHWSEAEIWSSRFLVGSMVEVVLLRTCGRNVANMEVELRMGRRSNVLLCRTIARIGEVFSKKTEGFCKNQRRRFGKFAENNPCGLCRHPYPREARTPPIRKQREIFLCFRLLTIRQYITHRTICLYRADAATEGDIAT